MKPWRRGFLNVSHLSKMFIVTWFFVAYKAEGKCKERRRSMLPSLEGCFNLDNYVNMQKNPTFCLWKAVVSDQQTFLY